MSIILRLQKRFSDRQIEFAIEPFQLASLLAFVQTAVMPVLKSSGIVAIDHLLDKLIRVGNRRLLNHTLLQSFQVGQLPACGTSVKHLKHFGSDKVLQVHSASLL